METTPPAESVVITKQSILFTVTPISRILAAVLFITLPFVGFWIGYTSSIPPTRDVLIPVGIPKPADAVNGPRSVEQEPDSIRAHVPEGVEPLKKEAVYSTVVYVLQDGVASVDFPYENSNLGARKPSNLGSGYYIQRGLLWSGVRDVYGGPRYVVGYEINSYQMGGSVDPSHPRFSVLYSSRGGDLLKIHDSYVVRENESWSIIPSLEGKTIRFLTPTLDESTHLVFYFTDETNVYAMFGSRPYEGCCTVMSDTMYVIKNADLATFEVVDKTTARDKTNVYVATMSEKGGVKLEVKAR